MPVELTWPQIALRLALSFVAGAIIGLDRSEHGRPAGIRTSLLVCLAAALSMILANRLLPTNGKRPDSFAVLDLMRLPLGILTGMGFIGAGAIIRQGDRVVGITTAAALWFETVLGLCFGGGELMVGIVGLILGMIILAAMKWMEMKLPQERHGTFSMTVDRTGPTFEQVHATISKAARKVVSWKTADSPREGIRQVQCGIQWRSARTDTTTPAFVGELAARPGVMEVRWELAPLSP